MSTCMHGRGPWRLSSCQWSSEVIIGHSRSSEAIRGHQRPSEVIRGHQRSSEVIRGHQRSAYLGDGCLTGTGLAVEDPVEWDVERLLAPRLALPVAQLEMHQLSYLWGENGRRGEHMHAGDASAQLEMHQLSYLGLHLVEAGECVELLELRRVVEHRLGTLMRDAIKRRHQRSSYAIRAQASCEIIRAHRRASALISAHQRSSALISGHMREYQWNHQCSSVASEPAHLPARWSSPSQRSASRLHQ